MHQKTIISFALEGFDGPWLSRQFLTTCLSKYYPVFHVTPADTFDSIRNKSNTRPFLGKTTTIQESLVHLDQGGLFPQFYDSLKTLNSLSAKLRMKRIQRAISSRGWPSPKVLYLWHPDYHQVIGSIKGAMSFFHCVDYYPDYFPESSFAKKLITRNMESSLQKADIVLVTCTALENKLREHVDRVYTTMPHGVNSEAFISNNSDSEPEIMKDIPHPRVAHIGRVNNKVNVGLLADIAERVPSWSVIIMGPIVSDLNETTKSGLARMEKLPNAFVLPGQPANNLPVYYNAMDLGLLAYNMMFWVPFGLPLKFFEFLAAGKPMVCSPLDSMKAYPQFVQLADNLDSWISSIDQCLSKNSNEKIAERISFSRDNTWDNRARKVIDLIDNFSPL